MEVELVFPVVGLALFAVVVWVSARAVPDGALIDENRAHLRLTWPPLMGALPISFLVGWAIQEVEPADESVSLGICFVAVLAAVVVLRALVRGGLIPAARGPLASARGDGGYSPLPHGRLRRIPSRGGVRSPCGRACPRSSTCAVP